MTTEWVPGMACRVVEHDEATREPKPGGRVLDAYVVDAAYLYVVARVLSGDPAGRVARFWAESGWTVRDGDFRWRLLPGTGGEAATAAETEG